MGTAAQLNDLIRESSNVVFFGGAGVSVPSGIPDFRSSTGLYNRKFRYPAETMLSHMFFMRFTEEFYDFYRSCMLYPDAKPNAAHLKLAELERAGKLKAVITQNIDGLHQAAGSKNVIELHGSVHRNYCMDCGKPYGLSYITKTTGVPRCESCGGIIKPDVVLYDESLDGDVIDHAINAIYNCDLLIVGGTSLSVYPAASFINYLNRNAKLAIVNLSPTGADSSADLVITAGIDSVFKAIEAD
ncbi:MAG: NAD-dependent protein deacylase [Oscillospiraceae bacterium]|nr:NAD-dependent protein deacylase [Oscillospiraceae bacterium]